MHWTVTKKQPLLETLCEWNPDSSRTTVRSWITEGRIWIGQRQVKNPKEEVYPEEEISLEKKRQYLWNGMEILYQDDQIIVIYKPAGLLTVATDTDLEDHAHACLKRQFTRRTIYPVHRLDRDASGILVFAFSQEAQAGLKEQFAEHSILREYIAVIAGTLPTSKGTWQSYLLEEENLYVHSVTDPSRGRLATTHYEVIGQKQGISVLKVVLETGRKNQIRVHASEAGCPILGDKKYGSKQGFHGRVALQACKLGIKHPTMQKPALFVRRPDAEFAPYLDRISEKAFQGR